MPMRWIHSIVVAAALVVAPLVAGSCGYESTTSTGNSGAATPTTAVEDVSGTTAETHVPQTSTPTTVDTTPPPTTVPPVPAPESAVAGSSTDGPAVPAGAVRVIDVIDGDTIKITGGRSVRLIGIDTPERGQCGYTEAAFVLISIIRDRPVVLVPGARTDTDRYGRLLRYVEVDGVDANLEMIRSGRAIARYDSRDGYGRHPREDLYVTTDAATPSTNNCTPPPGADKAAGPARSGGTDPRFGTCKEAKAAGYGGYVRGVDPEYEWYRDGDGDGIACE